MSDASICAKGYLLLRGFSPASSTFEVINQLGSLEAVEGLDPVQILAPQDANEAPPNTYSGNFGYGEFPLHTDLAHWANPPRYLALRCLRGSANVATRLFDGQALIEAIGADRLRMTLVQPRRPLRNGKQLLRLLEKREALLALRWDSLYLCPASRFSSDIVTQVNSFLAAAEPTEITLTDPGDTLVIDNWRFLHGRSSASGSTSDRRIGRAYLKTLQ